MQYRNFDLLIEPKKNDRYRVILLQAAEIEDSLCDSILSEEMQTILAELEKSVSDDLTPENLLSQVAIGEVDIKLMKRFGRALYECLFRQNILDAFNKAYSEVCNDDGLNLRIRLIIMPLEIAQLPWELMYDKMRDLFLCTSEKISITRILPIPRVPRSLTVNLPLRVLVAIPLNHQEDELNTAAERKIIEDAFEDLKKREFVELDFVDQPVTVSAINNKLMDKSYHIFHFSGHGRFDSDEGHLKIDRDERDDFLSEPDEEGWMSAESFATLFTNCHSMKLVVLNCCQGATISSTKLQAGVAPHLLHRHIPAVVAMQYPIFDDSALIFAREFYRNLCRSLESGILDPAVTNARRLLHINTHNGLDFATPVLLMGSSTDFIFDLQKDIRSSRLVSVNKIDRLNVLKSIGKRLLRASRILIR